LQRNDALWGDLGVVADALGTGFCFRVDVEDLGDQADQTWIEIIERSAEMGLTDAHVDVIVDLRFVGAIALNRLASLVHGFLGLRPRDFRPRFIAIAGSSVLKEVSSIPVDGVSAVTRQELLPWTSIQAQLGTSQRVAFGDYGVIHPDFSQSAPSKYANAKIRYTRGDSIHYFRGTRLFDPSNFGQYHALARRVVGSQQYRGPSYSAGDSEIWGCANRNTRPGNLGTWVRTDRNHHIETTVDQVQQVVRQLAQGADASRLIETLQNA
jgi:hypothetical protein